MTNLPDVTCSVVRGCMVIDNLSELEVFSIIQLGGREAVCKAVEKYRTDSSEEATSIRLYGSEATKRFF